MKSEHTAHFLSLWRPLQPFRRRHIWSFLVSPELFLARVTEPVLPICPVARCPVSYTGCVLFCFSSRGKLRREQEVSISFLWLSCHLPHISSLKFQTQLAGLDHTQLCPGATPGSILNLCFITIVVLC